jgi:hypothetical protein
MEIAQLTVVALTFDEGSDNPRVVPWTHASGKEPFGVTKTASNLEQDVAVLALGIVRDCVMQNGETWALGEVLWAKADGSITKTRPVAPTTQVRVGEVIKVVSTLVDVAVALEKLPKAEELSGVNRETLADKDVLIYKLSSLYWETRPLDHNTDLTNVATGDVHTQYLKEKASGGTAAEVPEHTHDSTAQGGLVNVRRLGYAMRGF